MSTPTPAPTHVPVLTAEAQAVISDFINEPGVTQDHLDNLQTVIESSPALISQINDAVAQGHLTNIAPLTNPNAGGEYDPQRQEMRLPLGPLATPSAGPAQAALADANANEVAFVLGHELQHGFNRTATQQAYTDFYNDVGAIAQTHASPRDYTAPTADLIAQNRRDEAGAEIAGWNAIVGRVSASNPTPTLQDIYEANPSRMRDFIDVTGFPPNATYGLKPNLSVNADLTMTASQANIEGMGQNYFDKPPISPGGLGALGNSDYVNYYGAYAVGVIGQVEQHYNPPQAGVTTPQVGLDMGQLNLSEKLMEENGIELGASTATLPYYDLGGQPPTSHVFQDTDTTNAHVSPSHSHGMLEHELAQLRAGGRVEAGDAARLETQAGRSFLGKIAEAVEGVGGQPGDTPVAEAAQRTVGSLAGTLREGMGAARQQAQAVLDAVQPEAREQGVQVETAQGRGLLGKIAEAVERSGVTLGDDPVAGRARISAGLLAEALKKNFTEHDELFVGVNRATERLAEGERVDMFRRNGSPDPVQNIVSVGREQALSTPVEDSYQQANAVLKAQQAEQRNATQQDVQSAGQRM